MQLSCLFIPRSENEQELEEYFKKRYASTSSAEKAYGGSDQELPGEIAQQTLLPGVK